jgi:hypothetical protein
VYDIGGVLVRVQVKSAWYDAAKDNYVVDTRRTKTNRREVLTKVGLHPDQGVCHKPLHICVMGGAREAAAGAFGGISGGVGVDEGRAAGDIITRRSQVRVLSPL